MDAAGTMGRLVGLVNCATGLLRFFGGAMSAAPGEGEKLAAQGCARFAIGALIFAACLAGFFL